MSLSEDGSIRFNVLVCGRCKRALTRERRLPVDDAYCGSCWTDRVYGCCAATMDKLEIQTSGPEHRTLDVLRLAVLLGCCRLLSSTVFRVRHPVMSRQFSCMVLVDPGDAYNWRYAHDWVPPGNARHVFATGLDAVCSAGAVSFLSRANTYREFLADQLIRPSGEMTWDMLLRLGGVFF